MSEPGADKVSAFTAIRAPLYVAFNVASATGIVFVNKFVMSVYHFHFVYFITFLHTMTTLVGMRLFRSQGLFERKELHPVRLLPLAAAYIGYVVLNNLSLQINTVGFYQISKIAIAPAVLALEVFWLGKPVTPRVLASVALVCAGVALATLTDSQIMSSGLGMAVGAGAVLVTALYQIWAGTYQKELKANSSQLLDQYCPLAGAMLSVIVLLFEPLGLSGATGGGAGGAAGGAHALDTIASFPYDRTSVALIVLSCLLGVAVNFSTFLVIGATSSLTFNIVGHIKTLLIVTGGCVFFQDGMTPQKLGGLCLAMAGIVWYTLLPRGPPAPLPRRHAKGGGGGGAEDTLVPDVVLVKGSQQGLGSGNLLQPLISLKSTGSQGGDGEKQYKV